MFLVFLFHFWLVFQILMCYSCERNQKMPKYAFLDLKIQFLIFLMCFCRYFGEQKSGLWDHLVSILSYYSISLSKITTSDIFVFPNASFWHQTILIFFIKYLQEILVSYSYYQTMISISYWNCYPKSEGLLRDLFSGSWRAGWRIL